MKNHDPDRRRIVVLSGAWLLGLSPGSRAEEAAPLHELRAGAAVLMRHTQTTPGAGDPPGWQLGQCQSQRNLAPSGIEHAKRIGGWFGANDLRVSRVRNSPWCRTRDTAMLAFDRHEDWAALSNIFEDRSAADAQAAQVNAYVKSLQPGELVVLVSHGTTIGHIMPGHGGLAPGEAVVVRAAAGVGAPLAVLGRLAVP